VENHHSPPKKKYAELTATLEKKLGDYANRVAEHIASGKGRSATLDDEQKTLIKLLNKSLDDLVIDIQKDDIGNRMGLLQTRILLELRDIVTELSALHAVYDENSSEKG
jgi:hypothetical protein